MRLQRPGVFFFPGVQLAEKFIPEQVRSLGVLAQENEPVSDVKRLPGVAVLRAIGKPVVRHRVQRRDFRGIRVDDIGPGPVSAPC